MFFIDKSSATPIYEQLYHSLIEAIFTGKLTHGTQLPATRKLAEELSISRNTVNKAYHQLVAEGYIQPHIGSGFIVNDICAFERPVKHTKTLSPQSQTPSARYDFDYGNIDNQTFPYKQWRKSVTNVLDSLEMHRNILYPHYMGEAALREEIARYLYRSRSVRCSSEQIVITSGHQYSVDILANLFSNEQKNCAMENPGYDGVRSVFTNHNYNMYYIPVEDNGVSVKKVIDLPLNLLYVTPSHQFPTGAVLSISKRLQLLEWARKTDTYIIEDDYDSELRYYTNPVPSMQSLDRHERVIYTGTFSKAFAPSIRIAYIVLPHNLLPRYHETYQLYGSQVSPLHQMALADFMARGYFERNINKLRTIYRKKQESLKNAIHEVFGHQITVSGEGAGLHLLLDIDTDVSPEELIRKAASIDIKLYSVTPYYAISQDAPKCQLQLGFPTIPQEKFLLILKQLKEIWEI